MAPARHQFCDRAPSAALGRPGSFWRRSDLSGTDPSELIQTGWWSQSRGHFAGVSKQGDPRETQTPQQGKLEELLWRYASHLVTALPAELCS